MCSKKMRTTTHMVGNHQQALWNSARVINPFAAYETILWGLGSFGKGLHPWSDLGGKIMPDNDGECSKKCISPLTKTCYTRSIESQQATNMKSNTP